MQDERARSSACAQRRERVGNDGAQLFSVTLNDLGLRRVPTQSRREHIVENMREAITNGRLKPGDRLIEIDLAKELGTGRGPCTWRDPLHD
ncbi:MAG: hypothetical protein ABIW84_08225, partial [Ilumatobacteraceae bacterium]